MAKVKSRYNDMYIILYEMDSSDLVVHKQMYCI